MSRIIRTTYIWAFSCAIPLYTAATQWIVGVVYINLTIIDHLFRKITADLYSTDWIIQAISKHVIAYDTLSSRNEYISIDESTHLGVVISGLEIV